MRVPDRVMCASVKLKIEGAMMKVILADSSQAGCEMQEE